MHVVFFNRSYYPDASATGQILTDLCEDLVRVHGCRVTVVTGRPLLSVEAVGDAAVPSREQHNGVEIVRAHGTRFSKTRFVGRALNYVTYFLSACWAGLRVDRPNVVVALTDPPIIGIAGWLSAKRFGVPFVMSYQDLFPEVAVLLEDFHSEVVNGALQSINRFLCRRATRIVALGETMRERLIDGKGADRAKTLVIPSGADTGLITPGPRHNAFSAAHGLDEKFVVMHSGNLGLSQNLDTLIDAAVLLRAHDDIRIVFQGEGVKKHALEERARAERLTNVLFLPFQPKDRMSESFAAADAFVISLQEGLAGYIVPSKLYGILAAGRPYVAAVEKDCEVATITTTYGCGLVARPGDAENLVDRLLELYRDRAMTARYGIQARVAGVSFDRRVQVAKYAALFDAIAQPGSVPNAGKIAAPSRDN